MGLLLRTLAMIPAALSAASFISIPRPIWVARGLSAGLAVPCHMADSPRYERQMLPFFARRHGIGTRWFVPVQGRHLESITKETCYAGVNTARSSWLPHRWHPLFCGPARL